MKAEAASDFAKGLGTHRHELLASKKRKEINHARSCAPVRRFLPDLIDLVWNRKINPGKVFDLTLPLDHVAEGYRAMDERRAIKTLLRP